MEFDYNQISKEALDQIAKTIPQCLNKLNTIDCQLDEKSFYWAADRTLKTNLTGEDLINFVQDLTPWVGLLRNKAESIEGWVTGVFRNPEDPWEALILHMKIDDNPNFGIENEQFSSNEQESSPLRKYMESISSSKTALVNEMVPEWDTIDKMFLPELPDQLQFGFLSVIGKKQPLP